METQERLDQLIDKGREVLKTHKPNPPNVIGFPTLDSGKFVAWKSQTVNFLSRILPLNSPYIETFNEKVEDGYRSSVEQGVGILESVKEDLKLDLLHPQDEEVTDDPLIPLLNIFENFHLVTRQLRSRYSSRDTLDVKDEYDVQDLLHSLLHLHFDDIRPEEWTPSYAGKSSRVDFLLKDYKVVIEVKKTRSGLTEKEVGSQLIDDIARYKSHPDCESLLCFVYDPDGYVNNPRGLENDLSRIEEDLTVKVVIRPL